MDKTILLSIRIILLFFLFGVSQTCGLDFSIETSYDRSYYDKWMHSIPGSLPKLSTNDTVYHDIPYALYVFFNEYSRNAFGIVNLSFSYKILRSDGSPVMDSAGISAFSGIIEPDAGTILNAISPIITLPKSEALGVYTLVVTAVDEIAEVKKTREKRIVCAKYPPTGFDRFDVISFNIWVHNFCITPDPGRVVTAFNWFIGSPSSNNEKIFWPVFYFFQSLFMDNPSLLEKLVTDFPLASERVQEYTVLLVTLIRAKRESRWPIPDSLWKKFDKVKETGYLDPFAVTFKSSSAQFLEMGFYYYGDYKMIQLLIECLSLNTRDGFNEFVKKCDRYGSGCKDAVDKEAALNLCAEARLILSKTYSKHQLVHTYCDYAWTYGTIPLEAKKVLAEIRNASWK